MGNGNLGRCVLVVNPVAKAGKGEEAYERTKAALESLGLATSLAVERTKSSEHAVELASSLTDFDTVVVVGGDGAIHHVANGLMRIDAQNRPALAVIPFGSGNDYAASLGMVPNDPEKAVAQLAGRKPAAVDIGLVNGTYFTETLSFGLDAAIAMESSRRQVVNKRTGTALYGLTGVDIFLHRRTPYAFKASWINDDGAEPFAGEALLFALQIGPTYGGGFRICPEASPTDGLLSTCRTLVVPGVARTLAIFGLARFGLHVRSNKVALRTTRGLHIEFDAEPPAQVDGEPLTGSVFDVSCIPGALRVYAPHV